MNFPLSLKSSNALRISCKDAYEVPMSPMTVMAVVEVVGVMPSTKAQPTCVQHGQKKSCNPTDSDAPAYCHVCSSDYNKRKYCQFTQSITSPQAKYLFACHIIFSSSKVSTCRFLINILPPTTLSCTSFPQTHSSNVFTLLEVARR